MHLVCCRAQRFQAFVIALVGGIVFVALALFIFLPLLLLAPSKFATSFTLGSLLFIVAFAMLRGPRSVFRQLVSPDKAIFSIIYVASIGTSCTTEPLWTDRVGDCALSSLPSLTCCFICLLFLR